MPAEQILHRIPSSSPELLCAGLMYDVWFGSMPGMTRGEDGNSNEEHGAITLTDSNFDSTLAQVRSHGLATSRAASSCTS